jgi:hypothetical protein
MTAECINNVLAVDLLQPIAKHSNRFRIADVSENLINAVVGKAVSDFSGLHFA